MKFIWFLALRYLKPRGTFFSLITLLSILGVLLGVGVLIVVIGVMSGFERQIKEGILGLQAQIVLNDTEAERGPLLDEKGVPVPVPPEFKGWREMQQQLKTQPDVLEVTPFVALTTLVEPDIEGSPRPEIAHFLGLDPADKDQAAKIRKMMVRGEFDLGSGRDGDNLVMNERLASRLGVDVGDKVNAFSPENMKEVRKAWAEWEKTKDKPEERKSIEEKMDRLLVPNEYVVAGLFNSLQHADYVVLSLESGQTLSGHGENDYVSGLSVTTSDAFRADEYLARILETAPPNWGGFTWIDKNRTFFDAIQNERSMMFLVLMIIVLVAAFSTMISMIIFAVQKRREIGMVRALGAKTSQVLGIFLGQGMVVGLLGVILGAIGGLLVLHYRNGIRSTLANAFNIQIFPADVYGLAELPAYLRPMDVFWICLPAFVLCSGAALLPAFFSSREDPARALRGER